KNYVAPYPRVAAVLAYLEQRLPLVVDTLVWAYEAIKERVRISTLFFCFPCLTSALQLSAWVTTSASTHADQAMSTYSTPQLEPSSPQVCIPLFKRYFLIVGLMFLLQVECLVLTVPSLMSGDADAFPEEEVPQVVVRHRLPRRHRRRVLFRRRQPGI